MTVEYQALATEDKPYSSSNTVNKKSSRSSTIRLFQLIVALAVMYTVTSSLRSKGFVRNLWSQCRGVTSTSGHARLPAHYTLPSGDQIPSVALGVWQASPGEVGNAVETALKAGYRHIDDAWIYRNEAEVGAAIRSSGVPRKDIWITSKLWNDKHRPEDVGPALDESLTKLGVDYLDLYLIHWPVAFKPGQTNRDGTPVVDMQLTNDPYPTWKALESLVDAGKIRNIGISNFNIRRIKNLTANPLKYQPAVNQVELNYFNPQPQLVKWASENDLLLEAYSPLGSNKQVNATLNVPEVQTVAKELGITPAQVVISWHVQRGTIVLPKSVTPSRIEENLKVVKLPEDKFNAIEKAATSHKPQRVVVPNWGVDVFEDEY